MIIPTFYEFPKNEILILQKRPGNDDYFAWYRNQEDKSISAEFVNHWINFSLITQDEHDPLIFYPA